MLNVIILSVITLSVAVVSVIVLSVVAPSQEPNLKAMIAALEVFKKANNSDIVRLSA